MSRIVKYVVFGGIGVLAVVGVGAGYLLATFDPNDYKAQIIKLVKDKKQRDLRLDGDIKLAFFPSIGANLGKVSLSEANSDKQFASIEDVHVSLALMPLLSNEMVVSEVLLSGLQATLIKHKDGSTNIDDLLGSNLDQKSDDGGQVKFDIASVSILNTNFNYSDEASGAQYAIKNLNLKTGRIANGVPVSVDLAMTLQGNQPKLDVSAQLQTMLTFDLSKKQYQLEGLNLEATGTVATINNLKLNVLNADADLGAQSFQAGELKLAFDTQQSEQAFKVKLSSPLSGDLATQQFSLSDLLIAVTATGDKLPNKSISSEMKGSVQLDVKKQTVQVNLAGGLLQSQIKAKVGVKGFANPAIHFDIDVDQLDADLYLPKSSNDVKTAEAKSAVEQPLDLSALRKLNLEGSLRIGSLKVANIKSSNVRIDVKARNGQLKLSPLSANLYQGSVSGGITVNAAATPKITIKQNLNGIDIAALGRDAADFDTLEGKGDVGINLTMRGNTVSVMKKTLNGKVSLNLADGAIKGINVAQKLRDAKAMFGKGGANAQTQAADKNEKTDFSELKASFNVKNGVARNNDLSLKAPLLRLSGNGEIDIANETMNYLAKATLSKTLQGQGGADAVGGITVPVRVSGSFASPKYTLDFGAMVGEAAKQKIEAKKAEIKTKVQDKLKESLKGLFR